MCLDVLMVSLFLTALLWRPPDPPPQQTWPHTVCPRRMVGIWGELRQPCCCAQPIGRHRIWI